MALIVNQKGIEFLINKDEVFKNIFTKYGAPPEWARPAGFTSLCKIILEQQVSLSSANAHFVKLNNYLACFEPSKILELSDEEMLRCQISRQKSSYLRALSSAIIHGQLVLTSFNSLDDVTIKAQLTSIKGIGQWSADIYMMFCLQSQDIIPLGDIAIINTIKELTPAKTKEEIVEHSSKWAPYRTLASYFLWHYYLKKRHRNAPDFHPNIVEN
ncbi:MAG: DNA-3-methyladenine glycosylase 2 family protein [Saprospiraceae bacterium]|nr:DNA-3-methyladenine glycosylase 2 family protein [Saprospiraceae bacterium]